ncbi:ribonucleotide reductase subunit alpha [uncultured Paraglaciecola sp.]|uniref:ribonucleotide reductase subunit alpha n=1 Tax=uncultured Paraglaciecola sp. TaxID=1765024 RepID=UPI0025EFCD93|nr:ribonucleotide reductase subunit alpha [uncultured Paraglaciecola sp.]
MISMFSDLLEMANEQTAPQRLLFLFAATEESNKSKKRDDKKGTITPTMVVDKLPSELTDFTTLVNEADSINKEWNFVFIASLSGDHNTAPSSEHAEPFLDTMTTDITSGNNINRYVVFDRQENPIELSAS